MRYGNLMNTLSDAHNADRPAEEGTPATLLMWSDRVPYVVTKVQNFKTGPRAGTPRYVWAQRVHVERDRSKPGGIGHQNWLIFLDQPFGEVRKFVAAKDGALRDPAGNRLVIGHAEHYYDWSF